MKPIVKEAQEPKQEPKKEVVKVESETETAWTAPVSNITHLWFPEDSLAQNIVRYAYDKYHDLEFIKMMECENGTYNLKSYWDNWHARWACQLNDRWHEDDIYKTDYLNDYKVAVDICYEHWKEKTTFYWYYTRKINWKYCRDLVASRFKITD